MSRLVKSNGYLGDYEEDGKVVLYYSTFYKNELSYDLSGDSGIDTEVYRKNSETPITDGIITTYNVNGISGVNRVVIDLSASGSYTTFADYVVTRIGSTIDTETVNALLGFFSIGLRL